jgi:hypothetical protein
MTAALIPIIVEGLGDNGDKRQSQKYGESE